MIRIHLPGKFNPGRIVATPALINRVPEAERDAALTRHLNGDWGIMSDADKQANDRALKNGERLFSAYRASDGTKFWIITEWDRSATTLLLPEDY